MAVIVIVAVHDSFDREKEEMQKVNDVFFVQLQICDPNRGEILP